MKTTYLVIVILILLGFTIESEIPGFIEQTEPISNFEHFNDCRYYQYTSNDSLNIRLSRSQLIDSLGRVIAVNTERFQINSYTFTGSGKTFRSYDDNGNLIGLITHSKNPNRAQSIIMYTIHEYKNDKLVNRKRYMFRKRLKEEPKFNHLLSAEDYEAPSWKLESDEYFYYDERGNLIESNAPELFTTRRL
ncbi:MAG: hypothetical protein LAT67_14485 [Balneolales bacterium]|nr:hypothetical protein [Balneolales bacterium]